MHTNLIDTWAVLGDCILAYRLHIVKKKGWLWNSEANLTTKTHDPGDAGFMNLEDKADDFEMSIDEVLPRDAGFFASEQDFGNVNMVDFEDDDEEWSLAAFGE